VKASRDIPHHRYFFPGHAGGTSISESFRKVLMTEDVLTLDLPELDELDNLHSPEGPLLESLALTARLFKSRRSWYLVNGRLGLLYVPSL
jgi:arginine/lysine/ornithine decarboxylase